VEVVFAETAGALRHAILRTGPDSWLHPAEIDGNAHSAGVPAMFSRGHIDHVALTAASYEAFGAELTVIVEPKLAGIHAPTPLTNPA
jgi:hypothetical protein